MQSEWARLQSAATPDVFKRATWCSQRDGAGPGGQGISRAGQGCHETNTNALGYLERRPARADCYASFPTQGSSIRADEFSGAGPELGFLQSAHPQRGLAQ